MLSARAKNVSKPVFTCFDHMAKMRLSSRSHTCKHVMGLEGLVMKKFNYCAEEKGVLHGCKICCMCKIVFLLNNGEIMLGALKKNCFSFCRQQCHCLKVNDKNWSCD